MIAKCIFASFSAIFLLDSKIGSAKQLNRVEVCLLLSSRQGLFGLYDVSNNDMCKDWVNGDIKQKYIFHFIFNNFTITCPQYLQYM